MPNDVAQLVLDQVSELRKELREERQRTEQRLAKLQADVAVLKDRQPPKGRQLARDGGLTVSGGALAAAILKLLEAI